MFSACRRADEKGVTHFDVRWNDGVLKFTGKLEVLPSQNSQARRRRRRPHVSSRVH